MKLQLWSVGKAHDDYVAPGIADFTRRIANYYPVAWNIIPPLRNMASLSPAEVREREAPTILRALKDSDHLILLDERGRSLTSPQLASMIQARANDSTRNPVFLIGGAYGTDAAVHQRADFVWSLSALTFPHQLVRLILSEQIYRACTILRNERYHHS